MKNIFGGLLRSLGLGLLVLGILPWATLPITFVLFMIRIENIGRDPNDWLPFIIVNLLLIGCGCILFTMGKKFRDQDVTERQRSGKRFGRSSLALAIYVGIVALIAVKIALDVAGIRHFDSQPLNAADNHNPYAYAHYSHKSACQLSGQAAHGREITTFCLSCHSIGSEGSPVGPNLQNIYMSRAGTVPMTPDWEKPLRPYVAARQAGVVWTDDDLFEYLNFPDEYLVGKTEKRFKNSDYMPFYVADPDDRRDIIAYLKVIKDHPECD